MPDEYSPIPELNLLKAFDQECGWGYYADGFELTGYDRTNELDSWSKDPEFVSHMIPFAQANGGGSQYAIWRVDDRADLTTLPVVVFGDEGGQHVVARDLLELFRLLGYDAEVSVDFDRAYYYRGDDDEHSTYHDQYVAWLRQHLGLAPCDDPGPVVEAAQAAYGERFTAWVEPLLTE